MRSTEVIDSALNSGAEGYCFSVHPTNFETLQILEEADESRQLGLYPVLPYAQEYVRIATEKGVTGLLRELVGRLSWRHKAELLLSGVTSITHLDPNRLFRSYLDLEMKSLQDNAPGRATIKAVFLHEVIVDGCVSLQTPELLFTFIERMSRKYGAVPGFVTRNLPAFVEFCGKAGVRLDGLAIMTPFNAVGFQMHPNRESCEEALDSLGSTHVVAMSILAAGYLNLPEAVEYLNGLTQIDSVIVGTSQPAHASATFSYLQDNWVGGQE